MDLRSIIRDVPNFPQPGILFRDITPVLEDLSALRAALAGLGDLLSAVDFDVFAAVESRGFVFGAPLALALDKRLVLCRKAGKLPCPTYGTTYALEYGEATLEMHTDSLRSTDRVVVIDDLLATGGTAAAAGELVGQAGAAVASYLFLVELCALGGRAKLTGAPVFSLVQYD